MRKELKLDFLGMEPFIHLHTHTQYSILDGQASIKKLIKKAMADRETYLADVKKRQDEYQASRQTNDNAFTQVTAPIANAAAGGFNF